MSWPVRSKRFGLYNGTPAANTFTSLGTVPAGKTWLLKEWSFYNGGATTKTATIVVKISGVVTVVDHSAAVASGIITGNNTRHFVLNAGDELGFQTSVSQLVHVTASGAQLG